MQHYLQASPSTHRGKKPFPLLASLLVAAAFMAFSPVLAYDVKVGGIYYNLDGTNMTAEVTYVRYRYSSSSNPSYKGEIVIPSEIVSSGNTYSVTSISDYAFYNCSGLTSVTIPNSITSVGNYAFIGCSGLKELTIEDGDSILSLGYNSYNSSGAGQGLFCNTTLKKLYLGRNLSYKSSSNYGYSPFYNKTNLESVAIGNSVTSIGENAFCGCTKLHSVTIGRSVTSIGDKAFSSSIEKVIWLPNTPPSGYSNIEGAYNYVANDSYSSLSNVTVYPYLSSLFEVDGIRYVPIRPSERTCDAIDCAYDSSAAHINIGHTVSYRGIEMAVKDIKPYVCYGNTHVKDVSIDYDGNIGSGAFYDGSAIETVTIHADTIGTSAFCGSMTQSPATLDVTVQSIGKEAFYGCTAIETATIQSNSIGTSAFSGSMTRNPATLDVTANIIGDDAFRNCSAIETATINTSTIGNEFYGCTGLKNVTMGDGVERIGNYAFSGCAALESFSFGTSMKEIGAEAFSDCTAMTKLVSKTATPPTCGTQALDDINKWTCTLYVPEASIAAYQGAEQWKEFFFIEATGIESVRADGGNVKEIFTLDGRRVATPQPGVNVVRYSDGTTRKIVVK